MKIFTSVFVFTVLLSSCSKNYTQDDQLTYFAENVQSELANRGIVIDLKVNLLLKQGLIDQKDAYGLSKGDDIYIDRENFDWAIGAGYDARIEGLMAHEIGHNLLNLRHSEKSRRSDFEGRPVIMVPGEWQRIKPENLSDMYDVLVLLLKES